MTTAALEPSAVAAHLRGRFGKPYLYEAECESTQLLLLGSDLPEGAVAVADHQTGGKGRHGRQWLAPSGSSILVSVLLRPPVERDLPELSLVAALATAETIEAETTLALQIKWPNDVMLNRRKVAGILCELADGVVVCGIGINVNQRREELPLDAPTEPGSLRTLTGTSYDRAALLASLLLRFEERYDDWLVGGLPAIYPDVGARDFLRGRHITVDGDEAVASMIRPDGRLEVWTDNGHGETRVVESGEVLFAR